MKNIITNNILQTNRTNRNITLQWYELNLRVNLYLYPLHCVLQFLILFYLRVIDITIIELGNNLIVSRENSQLIVRDALKPAFSACALSLSRSLSLLIGLLSWQ